MKHSHHVADGMRGLACCLLVRKTQWPALEVLLMAGIPYHSLIASPLAAASSIPRSMWHGTVARIFGSELGSSLAIPRDC